MGQCAGVGAVYRRGRRRVRGHSVHQTAALGGMAGMVGVEGRVAIDVDEGGVADVVVEGGKWRRGEGEAHRLVVSELSQTLELVVCFVASPGRRIHTHTRTERRRERDIERERERERERWEGVHQGDGL